MKNLKDKVAIITGAGSGIGLSTAELFAQNGAKLLLTDIREEPLAELKTRLSDEGAEVETLVSDAAVAAESEKVVNRAIDRFGKLDIAVNNAGIAGASLPTAEYPIDSWDNVINLNLSGVFYGMRYQIPAMESTSTSASIVNIASILGQVGFLNAAAYVAAKHGVVGLTRTAALEYSKKGIRINAVGPAFIDTPLLAALDEATYSQLIGLHPIGRLGKPEEVAELILWLAGDRSSFVSGSYYPIDGGYLAQ